jgi:hypothetical protein
MAFKDFPPGTLVFSASLNAQRLVVCHMHWMRSFLSNALTLNAVHEQGMNRLSHQRGIIANMV